MRCEVKDPEDKMGFIDSYLVVVWILFIILMKQVKDKSSTLSKYGSTKFTIAISLLFLSTYLTLTDRMNSEDTSELVNAIGLSYGLLNTLNKVVVKKYKPADLPELEDTKISISRKYIVCVMMIAVATMMALTGNATSADTLVVYLVAGGMFGLTNIVSKYL